MEEIDDSLIQLSADMFETMHIAEGIGLAANQVGVSKSLLVIDISYFHKKTNYKPLLMINPEITAYSEEESEYEEGCLSVPTLHEIVVRPKEIEVKFQDINLNEYKMGADDILARVMQHEIDHLNGILFFERLTPLRKTLSKNKLKKIKKGIILPDYPMVLPDGRLAE